MAAKPYRDAVLAASGLVSFWELGEEEANAADLKDANTGTFNGSPTRAQASLLPNGEGRCVRLTPTTQFVNVPDASNLHLGDTFSILVYGKPNTVSANRGIVSKGNKGFYLRVGSTGKLELLKSQTATIVAATETLTAGTAYQLCATKSGATVKLYVNGADKTGTVTNATIEDNAIALNIGGDSQFSTERFDGWLQYVAIFNAALSAGTVAELKAAGEQAMISASGTSRPLSSRNRVASQ